MIIQCHIYKRTCNITYPHVSKYPYYVIKHGSRVYPVIRMDIFFEYIGAYGIEYVRHQFPNLFSYNLSDWQDSFVIFFRGALSGDVKLLF